MVWRPGSKHAIRAFPAAAVRGPAVSVVGLSSYSCLLVVLPVVAACLLADRASAYGPAPGDRVFRPEGAERARQLAATECKPLVVHFVPNNQIGRDQLSSYYTRGDGVPKEVLERVVIVVLPMDQYRDLARELGVRGGGFRSISPFHLDALDHGPRTTCRAGGFR